MTRARRTALMRQAGPYRVESCADGTLVVIPEWPGIAWGVARADEGPGLSDRMALAADLERWLNAPWEGKE